MLLNILSIIFFVYIYIYFFFYNENPLYSLKACIFIKSFVIFRVV